MQSLVTACTVLAYLITYLLTSYIIITRYSRRRFVFSLHCLHELDLQMQPS